MGKPRVRSPTLKDAVRQNCYSILFGFALEEAGSRHPGRAGFRLIRICAVSCSIPFHDPQGSVLVQGPDGDVNQVSVKWTLAQCDLKTGVFRIFVQPGTYHVSFTGYPLTLPSNAEIGGTNLPLTVYVDPHRLTQVRIGINWGI